MGNSITVVGSAHSFVYQHVLASIFWLLIASGLLTLAWWRRWLITAGLACMLLLWVGWILQPWLAFISSDAPGNTSEPHLLAWWRSASVGWAVLFVGGLGNVVALVQLRRL